MANKPTSPLDATGRAVEDASKRTAAEASKRQEEISLARQAEEVALENDVFDPKQPEKPILIDEIEEIGVAVNNDTVIIRTVTDIDDMTYGVINGTPQNYTFKQNVKYKVPRDLANYLQELGYVWLN